MMKWLFPIIVSLFFLVPQKSEAEPWQMMNLVGSGEYKYLGFISLYKARLFTDGDIQNALAPRANRCLVLDYHIDIKAEQFTESANSILLRQLATSELEHLRSDLDRFHASYRTVGDGDRYSLCFDGNSQTTSLALNGENLVSIRSSEFAEAYFGIWLGDREPIDQGLRDDLLGTKKSRRTSLLGGDVDV